MSKCERTGLHVQLGVFLSEPTCQPLQILTSISWIAMKFSQEDESKRLDPLSFPSPITTRRPFVV